MLVLPQAHIAGHEGSPLQDAGLSLLADHLGKDLDGLTAHTGPEGSAGLVSEGACLHHGGGRLRQGGWVAMDP